MITNNNTFSVKQNDDYVIAVFNEDEWSYCFINHNLEGDEWISKANNDLEEGSFPANTCIDDYLHEDIFQSMENDENDYSLCAIPINLAKEITSRSQRAELADKLNGLIADKLDG